MEIQLILGPNNSGKSLYAETSAVNSEGGSHIYLATMIPQNAENHQRIAKHLRQRDGKGFQTIEEPWNIHQIDISSDSVVLLEDASNLLANGIFIYHSDAKEALRRITLLSQRCQKLIIVSIGGLMEGHYDDETNDYISQLNWLNEALENLAADCKKMKAKPRS